MGLLLRKMVFIMTSPIDYTINQKEIKAYYWRNGTIGFRMISSRKLLLITKGVIYFNDNGVKLNSKSTFYFWAILL